MLLGLTVLAGIILRFVGASTQLWLDEIWSLKLVSTIKSPVDLFFTVYSNNNHPLNSLYMYLVGGSASFFSYRIPSLIAGLLSIPLIAAVARRHGRVTSKIGLLLFSISYVTVLYGSEARGYSTMSFFTLLAFWLHDQYLREASVGKAMLFWLCCALGLLSHYTFLFFFLALLGWSGIMLGTSAAGIRKWMTLHLVPCLFSAFIFAIHIRHLEPGTGTVHSYLDTIVNSLAMPFGGPELSPNSIAGTAVSLFVALFVLACIVRELAALRHGGDRIWIFYSLVIVILPLASLAVLEPHVVYLRYFYCSIIFSLIVFASALSRMIGQGRVFASAVIVVLIVAGNVTHLGSFAMYGRGSYIEALSHMAELSDGSEIVITGNQDYRNLMLIEFYADRIRPDVRLKYVPDSTDATGEVPTWYLFQNEDRYFSAPATLQSAAGKKYSLSAHYSHGPLSGAELDIYRAAD